MKIVDQLRERIEEQITTGELLPGSILDEATLVAAHGVSPTPVREALIQLAAEGLVEMRPRRGAVVTHIGPMRLIEMFEVMAELEAMCGRLAALRMSDAERAELGAAHRACEAARDEADSDAYFYCNEYFHALIYAGSHNGFLRQQTMQLHRRLQLRARDRIRSSFDQHDAVVRAIVAGDAEAAAAAMRDHVVVQGERFGDLLASLEQMKAGPHR
jgi:DNA-binding GntR family transcriptional regulator